MEEGWGFEPRTIQPRVRPNLGHNEIDQEFAERSRPVNQQLPDAVTVKVQIPVSTAYVARTDRIEGHKRSMTVEFDGSNVILRCDPPGQSGLDSISFPWAGIEAAIKMLGSLK